MSACWAELSQSMPDLEVHSVGLCSQVNTHLFVGADGRPLRPAITWQDTRASAEAAELDAMAAPIRAELWGGPFVIDSSFSLARLLWLARHEPRNRVAARLLLLPKDYCIAALTGAISTDAISAIGLTGAGQDYVPGVLGLVEGAAELLPPLRAFDRAAGVTVAGNPVGVPADIPVAVGTMDAWGSIFGAGLLRPGRGLDVAGTSEIVAVSSTTSKPTAGIVSVPAGPWHARPRRAHPVRWFRTRMGGGTAFATVPEALEAAALSRTSRNPSSSCHTSQVSERPTGIPTRAACSWASRRRRGRPPGLATLEGVAFSVRMLAAHCEAARRADRGAATVWWWGASDLWNQIKADVLDRPVDVLEGLDAGVLGATLLGLVAAGHGDLAHAVG